MGAPISKEAKAAYDRKRRAEKREQIAACKRAYVLANRERVAARKKAWVEANREHVVAHKLAWREARRDDLAKYTRDWAAANPDRAATLTLQRRLRRKTATPPWADLAAIRAVYVEAAQLRERGVDVHVDHYYPLRGKLVSGLHVHNNLRVILAGDNRTKSNHMPEEETQ